MILINSIDQDLSTNYVVKWLLSFKANFIRYNYVVGINKIEYINNRLIVEFCDGRKIDINKIKSYWYRRGENIVKINLPVIENEEFKKMYLTHIFNEYKSLKELFINHLKKKYCIGDSISCINVNKNIILLTAKECGLKIPEFIITTEKDNVIKFIKEYKKIITKSINNTFIYNSDDLWYPSYTEIIKTSFLKKMPKSFEPTLFQKYIEKKYEIRTFYLKGEFYSMAIFSQNDSQTKTDFRIYNDEVPNRNVPFKLPKNIEKKLDRLMKKLCFESGSFDLIYTPDKEFYFLEVNPVGQFGMVSFPCNYYLEKILAKKLIECN